MQLLGAGGMGEVFLARKGAAEPVVIKRILPRLAAQKEFLDRFLHEARVVARLSDPTIVRIVELGDVDGQWFLAMEFVDGVDVQTLLEKGPLPLNGACRVGLEAATALSVAHGARDSSGRLTPVVHRDVSPHNLLVSSSGAVKLIDFGVASLTGQGATGGKLAYSAPEQLLDDATDAASDQYSLGVVLWECLAQRQAFDADEDVEVIRLVTEVGVPPLPNTVPAPLREVVARMTALDPANRFADVATARTALLSEVRALKLDVSPAALAPLVPVRARSNAPVAVAATGPTVQLDHLERLALAVVRDGMTVEEAEAAIDGACLPGAPFALDLLQTLVEKGALRLEEQGGERRFRSQGFGGERRSGDFVALNYEVLWKVLEGSPSLQEVEKRLVNLSDDQLKGAAAAFVDARTELVDALTQRGTDASEDILDDLAGVLIRGGEGPYGQYVSGSLPLPPSEKWGDLEEASLATPFTRVVRTRLRTTIFDLWESEV